MTEALEMVLGLWTIINIFGLIMILMFPADDANFSFVNPLVIYDNIKVNWFGAWTLAIISNILFPTMAIPYWIYKIFTVGR